MFTFVLLVLFFAAPSVSSLDTDEAEFGLELAIVQNCFGVIRASPVVTEGVVDDIDICNGPANQLVLHDFIDATLAEIPDTAIDPLDLFLAYCAKLMVQVQAANAPNMDDAFKLKIIGAIQRIEKHCRENQIVLEPLMRVAINQLELSLVVKVGELKTFFLRKLNDIQVKLNSNENLSQNHFMSWELLSNQINTAIVKMKLALNFEVLDIVLAKLAGAFGGVPVQFVYVLDLLIRISDLVNDPGCAGLIGDLNQAVPFLEDLNNVLKLEIILD